MLSHKLPKDLMEEIFVRLPVKSLFRFKCEAKSWYALITDPSLIARHLERSRSTSKIRRLKLIFDFSKEVFGMIILPSAIGSFCGNKVFVLEESLAVAEYDHNTKKNIRFGR
ncbi:putative F-box protein At3g47150 [Neltuma alba]|uniref:putative F-box protein At3g47150 n=1 Tax=Neltuma alba TaxID=207710 RepID=UPI0010A57CF6|nr:putative F-box protein At3g47150 [Prosopis alba]